MHNAIGLGAQKVGPGHVKEILLGNQDSGSGVIQVQKGLQVGELIGGVQAGLIGIGQRNVIALGQLEDQVRFQRAFNMKMQFGLGQLAGKFA
jgi:hypothetical protein